MELAKTDFEKERDRLHLQMLSAVSHDLKTPLAAIIGSLEIHTRFKDTLAEEKKNILLTTALQEAYRLDSFITNILDMSKLDNNFVNVRKQSCDVKLLLEEGMIKMSHLIDRSDFTITSTSSQPVMLQTDSALLTRALNCLIDNAAKHAGVGAKIDILYGYKNEAVFISVKDNGPGIPDEKRAIIFDKYTRLAKQDHQNAGTGLGLAICRSIVSLLGGEVYIENVPTGACFTLLFK